MGDACEGVREVWMCGWNRRGECVSVSGSYGRVSCDTCKAIYVRIISLQN